MNLTRVQQQILKNRDALMSAVKHAENQWLQAYHAFLLGKLSGEDLIRFAKNLETHERKYYREYFSDIYYGWPLSLEESLRKT